MTPEHHDDAHIWQTRSTHRTLEGRLRYQHCPCGLWRIMTEDREVAFAWRAADRIDHEPADHATARPPGSIGSP